MMCPQDEILSSLSFGALVSKRSKYESVRVRANGRRSSVEMELRASAAAECQSCDTAPDEAREAGGKPLNAERYHVLRG